MLETPEVQEELVEESWATEDPTDGLLEPTEFPEDEYPDPPNDQRRDVVGLYYEEGDNA